MAELDATGSSATTLHLAGGGLLVARLLHAVGIQQREQQLGFASGRLQHERAGGEQQGDFLCMDAAVPGLLQPGGAVGFSPFQDFLPGAFRLGLQHVREWLGYGQGRQLVGRDC